MRTAIVFDSAGTLLKVYRVAKDVARKQLVENVVSTNIIVKGHNCALVALKAEPVEIFGIDKDIYVSEFIDKNNILMDIVCRGTKCPGEQIREAAIEDRSATIGDLQEAIAAVKFKCKDIYYVNIGLVVDIANRSIPYVLATGGKLFTGVTGMIGRIMASGADVYIASGDNYKSLITLAEELKIPLSNVYDALSPSGKRDVVMSLKEKYDRVIMVGDGINDQLAFQAADMGVLTLQQDGTRPVILYESADLIVDNILEVENIVEESLHMIKEQNRKNQ
ncbi:haloacid dehalogenase [Methanocella sp. CWC-04]|uniref:Haloacid dehalogenase n=1 Tax=Methanooceanicella nereidis TaxID=2052831 RepID=A0AAP2RDS0_9EURY|nr:HAD family hydrolase [Methanocella sp. CWC-04]MCD1295756.1 haloacid dehalogenase [Methanocella sp. CWC-04]